MHFPRFARLSAGSAAAALLLGLLWSAPAPAAPALPAVQRPVFVSPGGDAGHSGRSCRSARFSSIDDAVQAAPAGVVVAVCPGTYAEDVLVDKPLTLVGFGATIDATGLENAVQVVASHVFVGGFTLENANGEGALVGVDALADAHLLPPGPPVLSDVTIQHNRVVHDNQGFNGTEEGNCKYPGDCGAGIHLNGVTHSLVRDNQVLDNADGILLTDDYAPNSYNELVGNVVNHNTHECGIVLASHSSDAVSFDPNTFAVTGRNPSRGGIYGNFVLLNVADGNGTDKAPPEFGGGGSGSGIGLFASGPGAAVWDNVVVYNEASGNGLAGVAMHAHHPGGNDLGGNVVAGNLLGTDNIGGDGFDGPPTMDFQTTGIAVFSVPSAHMIIAFNRIHDDTYGIWLSSTVQAAGLASNAYSNVGTPVVVG